MASHNQPGADILPFGQPTDAPGLRFVRPIPAEQIARIMGEPVDLYKSLEPVRRGLLDRVADFFGTPFGFGAYIGFIVGCFSTVGLSAPVAIAAFCVVWFGLQLVRRALTGPGVIEAEGYGKCQLCGTVGETRPYGPNGEEVCFDCGMKDEGAAERGFLRFVCGLTEAEARREQETRGDHD